MLASVLTLCLEGHCWPERSGLCILAPTCGKQVGLGEGWLASVHCCRKPNSAVTAKQQLFKASRKAGVSSTKSLHLQRAWMINTSSLQNTAMWNVCWAAGFAFRIANSLPERRQNQICASYCYVNTKEHQRSRITLPLLWQLCSWVWRPPFLGYTGKIHHVFSTSLHLTKLASAPAEVRVFCHWCWWGLV